MTWTLGRMAMLAAAILLLIGLISWGPSACSKLIAEREARKIESGQAEATLDSLDVANKTVAEREALADAIEAEAEALADAIREAPPGNSNDAADKAVCQTRTYRDTPRCVELLGQPTGDPTP